MGRAKELWVAEKDAVCERYINMQIRRDEFLDEIENYTYDQSEAVDLADALESERETHMRYTKAPWTNDNGLVCGRDREHDECPSFDIFDAADWSGPEDEGYANARLIAAAPDLLEALELILPLAKGYRAQPKSDQARATNSSWILAAEAAINKAKGATNDI